MLINTTANTVGNHSHKAIESAHGPNVSAPASLPAPPPVDALQEPPPSPPPLMPLSAEPHHHQSLRGHRTVFSHHQDTWLLQFLGAVVPV